MTFCPSLIGIGEKLLNITKPKNVRFSQQLKENDLKGDINFFKDPKNQSRIILGDIKLKSNTISLINVYIFSM